MARHKKTAASELADWRNVADDREKYNAYLCSREWSVKKEAVKQRCGGICERCKSLPVDHVHHLTYARKYNEDLEDLQGRCKPCHEFEHGKSDFDPLKGPIVIDEAIYLAGKISRGDWRENICHSIRDGKPEDSWKTQFQGIHWEYQSREFCCHYAGPFFTCAGHGQDHGAGTHGNAMLCKAHERDIKVFNRCMAAIDASDIILAWFDDLFQYGTICEIGYAYANKKPVGIGYAPHMARYIEDLWFPLTASQGAGVYETPEAFVRWWLEGTAQSKIDHRF